MPTRTRFTSRTATVTLGPGADADLRVADDLPHDVFFGIREKDGQFAVDLVLDRANLASPNFGRWFSKTEASPMLRDEVSHKVEHDCLLAWEGVTVLQSTDIFFRARALDGAVGTQTDFQTSSLQLSSTSITEFQRRPLSVPMCSFKKRRL